MIDIVQACQGKLNLLLNQTCWGVLVGAPNAQVFYMYFGAKIEMEKPVNNSKLAPDLRKYDGEFVLAVYCDWRLQQNGRPITGSCEPNEMEGHLVKSMEELIGESISAVEITDECGDIALHFGAKTLKVFCVYTGNEDEDYWPQWERNWYLYHLGNHIITVTQGCQIVLHD